MQRDENEDLVEHEVIPDEGTIPVLRPLRFILRSLWKSATDPYIHPPSRSFLFFFLYIELDRINEVIHHLNNLDEFQIFKSSVDFEAYPDYCKLVSYPICLDSIQERLESGFYRRARVRKLEVLSVKVLYPVSITRILTISSLI